MQLFRDPCYSLAIDAIRQKKSVAAKSGGQSSRVVALAARFTFPLPTPQALKPPLIIGTYTRSRWKPSAARLHVSTLAGKWCGSHESIGPQLLSASATLNVQSRSLSIHGEEERHVVIDQNALLCILPRRLSICLHARVAKVKMAFPAVASVFMSREGHRALRFRCVTFPLCFLMLLHF